MKWKFPLAYLIVFLCNLQGQSQESVVAKSTEPRIGLALSGGAAHGFAHIGVLKYMEELGIQPDYITGTSMGSVIGGLYAMGFTAENIGHIASQIDWKMIMSNQIPLAEIAPIEKRYHQRIPISALWKNSSFRFPSGLIRGQKLDLVISRVYCPAHDIDDFDDFKIPFRCVAVDIVDGSVDALDSGYLGESIRASMAIPSIFPPKKLNDVLYVDGGLIRNFPVEEVIEMGADKVIGVYVGSEKATQDELHSLLDILKQSASMGNLLDSENQKELVDVLVLPDVKDEGGFDFSNYEALIQAGYDAAKLQYKAFEKLQAVKEIENTTVSEPLSYPQSLRFSEVTTNIVDPVFEKMILNKVDIQEGYEVSLDQLEENLSLLYGTKNFSHTAYSFYKTDEGLGLFIEAEEVDPFALGINVNYFENYSTALIISGEARNVLGKPSYLRMDARVSDFPGIQGSYFVRFPRYPSLLFRAGAQIEKSYLPFYKRELIDRGYDYEESDLKLELMHEWKNKFLFSGGYRRETDLLKRNTIRAELSRFRSKRASLFVALEYNNLDKYPFSKTGVHGRVEFSHIMDNQITNRQASDTLTSPILLGDKSYQKLDMSIDKYWSLGERLTFQIGAKGRLDFGSSFSDNYRIGGPPQVKENTYGFIGVEDSGLLLSQHISLIGSCQLGLTEKLNIAPVVQYATGQNVLSEFYGTEGLVQAFGFGLRFGYDSPLGPVFADFGYSDYYDQVIINIGVGYRHID